MDIKKITQSKTLKLIIIVILVLAIVSAVFQAGVFFGFKKASFIYGFGDNYYRNFGGPMDRDFMGMRNSPGIRMMMDETIGGHGAIGRIIKIDLPNIIVLGNDNIERNVIVNASTSIHEFRDIKTVEDLKTDSIITVLGSPDTQGKITAKFIRIMPKI